jgi:hypothetical protein
MARPIELGLILEGEDAEEFVEDLLHPKVSEKKMRILKKAQEIYKAHPV